MNMGGSNYKRTQMYTLPFIYSYHTLFEKHQIIDWNDQPLFMK